MRIEKFLIAGRNSTLLIWDCPAARKKEIVKKYLGETEQIGFVSVSEKDVKLL